MIGSYALLGGREQADVASSFTLAPRSQGRESKGGRGKTRIGKFRTPSTPPDGYLRSLFILALRRKGANCTFLPFPERAFVRVRKSPPSSSSSSSSAPSGTRPPLRRNAHKAPIFLSPSINFSLSLCSFSGYRSPIRGLPRISLSLLSPTHSPQPRSPPRGRRGRAKNGD